MTIQTLLIVVVVVTLLVDAEMRHGLISRFAVKLAACLLPQTERARYIEQWTADLHDTPGAMSRFFMALDLFRAGAGVSAQVIAQQLSVGLKPVSTATNTQRGNVMNAVAIPVRSQALVLSESPRGMSSRLSLGTFFAIFVTVGLLWVMSFLITTHASTPEPTAKLRLVPFVRVKPTPEPFKPYTPELIKPQVPPEAPKRSEFPGGDDGTTIAVVKLPPGNIVMGDPTEISFAGEGDLLELVVVRPIYPPQAEQRGLEGWCTVQYTVSRSGTVIDPAIVENQCSHSLFQHASLNAALKFRYKPRIIDGIAVDVPGVTKKFNYVMEK